MKKEYRTMGKKSNGKIREVTEGSVTLELPLPIAEIMMGLPHAIEQMSREVGLALMDAAMMGEGLKLAGPKGRKDPERTAHWWGSDLGSVCYDGQKHAIEHPRLRGKDNKEIPLQTYKAFQRPDGMRDLISRRLVLGLSSRNYEEAVEGFLKGYGIKKSSVSRQFIKATAQQMREFLERDLSALQLCAIFIDGIEFKGHVLIVALGLDVTGKKHMLGLREGATENSEVCMGLLEDMARRGLAADGNCLFVLDGAKALRSAVTRMYGSDVAVQRCQQHKRRNVRDHLPVEHQDAIDARIRAAYNMKTYEQAKQSLELTVKYLERLNPSAAASLKEGLEETLTVHKLGIAVLLRKTLCTTNPIESCFSVARTVTGRVKRWRGGDMVQRWAVASLLRAEKKFRRIKGFKEIPKLLTALKKRKLDGKEEAA
jgi:transposase-like protein